MNGPIGEYESFAIAYDHFNATLFDGRLPLALITLRNARKKGSLGYFSPKRFTPRSTLILDISGDKDSVDEIALIPETFMGRTDREILGTLVHEMAHLWQFRLDKPPRAGYHDRRWGMQMKQIGLYPSNTGEPGGKETGQQMDHFIVEGGPFAVACAALLDNGFVLEYQSIRIEAAEKEKKKSKIKYSCPECEQNAWAKPEAKLICGECEKIMEAEDGQE